MKKVILALFSIMVLSTAVVPLAHAADPFNYTCSNGETAQGSEFCKNVKQESSRSLLLGDNSLLVKIAQIIVYITAAISVVVVIIGGFRYVLSGGDASGVKGAKDTILYALIGLVVAVFAQVIVSFVLARLR